MHPEKLRKRTLGNWLRLMWQFPALFSISCYYHWIAVMARYRDPAGDSAYQVAKRYGRAVLTFMRKRVEVVGEENIKGLEYFAIAANHASYLDFAILLGYFPTPVRFIAKKELQYVPTIGRYLRSCGVIIDRKERKSALQAIEMAIHDGNRVPILIFAEGTRSDDGIPKRFKPGGLSIFARHRVPIVPVTLINTHANLPRRAITYRIGGSMKMIIGKPILPAEFSGESAVIEAVERTVHQTFAKEQPSLLRSVA